MFIVVLLTFSRVIIDDCTGEINLPLRLRCVRCYTFTQWMNLVVCLLDYEWCTGEIILPLRLRCFRWYYAMNKPCCVFVVLWMMYGRDKSAPTPCGMFAVIDLRNEWTLWCVCWIMKWCTGEMNLPYVYGVFADITQWINLAVCLLDYEWLSGEINLPLRLRYVRCYTFTQWIDPVECPLIYILSNK